MKDSLLAPRPAPDGTVRALPAGVTDFTNPRINYKKHNPASHYQRKYYIYFQAAPTAKITERYEQAEKK